MQNPIKPTASLLLFSVIVVTASVLADLLLRHTVVFIGILSVVLTLWELIRSRCVVNQYGRCSVIVYFPALVLLGAVLVSGFNALSISNGWLKQTLFKRDIQVAAKIISLPVTKGDFTRLDVEPIGNLPEGFPSRVRLTWRDAQTFEPGSLWEFTLRLRRPRGFASAGAFDYEAWIARQGIQATGYVKDARLLALPEDGEQRLNRLRFRLQQWLQANLDSDRQGMVMALLTGDKSGISQEQWQQLNRTGTTHLMVISGLHIGLMASLGYWLALLFGRLGFFPLRIISLPVVAGISGLLLAVFYAALAGFSIPVQRALVMTLVALSCPVLGSRPSSMTLWLLALAVVLAVDPLAFTGQGFWYSFIAVAALLFGLGGRKNTGRKWLSFIRPQWVVFLILTPLLLVNGQPVSPLSPLINMLAIPLVGGLVVPLLLLAGLSFAWIPLLAGWLLMAADQLLSLFQSLLDIAEPLVNVIPPHSGDNWLAILLTILAGVLLITPAPLKLRWLSPVLVLPWFFPGKEWLGDGLAEVTVLDVGQGLSVLVQTRQHTFLYDTGDRFTDEITAAERVIVPALRKKGIEQIDRIMISHGDRDHSGGLAGVMDAFAVGDIFAGSEIADISGSVPACYKNQYWQWDNVHFEVLAGGGHSQSNNCSCVLKITAGDDSLLLPGDISSRVERQMLSEGTSLKARILLAPHHGSKYSSSADFLDAVRPEVVIFSSGYANRFGHPAPETIGRVQRHAQQVYNTAEHGALSFKLGDPLKPVLGYRQIKWRYWWR